VNGEETTDGHVYRETDPPAPQDPYGISKWETEQVLHQIAAETGLEIVIVRPPLVYGPGVKGNFLQLLKAVYAGIPLPLAKVNNARSLLYLGNLVDILLACAIHPAAKGRTYLLRDGEDISVKDLARELGMMLGRRAKMFALPGALLQAMATVIGRQDMWNRLTTSLCLDDAAIRREIGWEPKYTLRQGLQATATWYKGQRNPSL